MTCVAMVGKMNDVQIRRFMRYLSATGLGYNARRAVAIKEAVATDAAVAGATFAYDMPGYNFYAVSKGTPYFVQPQSFRAILDGGDGRLSPENWTERYMEYHD